MKTHQRGNTLKLICDILDIDIPILTREILKTKPNQIEIIISYFFLIIINLTFMEFIIDYFRFIEATTNSKFVGLLLSFLFYFHCLPQRT
jgi:hypothetical protein